MVTPNFTHRDPRLNECIAHNFQSGLIEPLFALTFQNEQTSFSEHLEVLRHRGVTERTQSDKLTG